MSTMYNTFETRKCVNYVACTCNSIIITLYKRERHKLLHICIIMRCDIVHNTSIMDIICR